MARNLIVIALVIILTIAKTGELLGLDYIPGVLLVRFNLDVNPTVNQEGNLTVGNPELDRLFTRFKASEFHPFFGEMIIKDQEYCYRTRNDYQLHFPEKSDMELIAAEFNQIRSVEWAEPDYLIPLLNYIPNDPLFHQQWWLEIIDAGRAWVVQTGENVVVVAAIDTGVDWKHPDLIENIWVNPGEDIDLDHRPYDPYFPDLIGTLGDQNGRDDDGNGLIDDFIGYDWVTVSNNQVAEGEDGIPIDNDPRDFNGHGTGCNSAMAERGDNGIGALGVAFTCKIMGLRAGYENRSGDGAIQLSSAVQALAYATENDADVISLSYGGPTRLSSMQDAVNNAWNSNMLIFGAAGNSGVNEALYPANYEHVFAVAATDRNDRRADFSNWGAWVDIAAPGTDCLTAWFDHESPNPSGYASWNGTSVSTPIAAGLGALVISQYQGFSNSYWENVILSTTDSIDADHPIGTGRINAYKAVTQFYWPNLNIDEIHLSDPDGNGHPDRGETIEVRLTISNALGWRDADQVFARLAFDVNGIQLNQERILVTARLHDGATVYNNNNPLIFTVPEDWGEGRFVNMTVTVVCDPNEYEIAESVRLLIGTPQFILVDDDGGEEYDSFLCSDLDEFGYVYDHLDVVATAIQIDEYYLSRYEAILWMTGDVENPLTMEEISALEGALNIGVNLFLFGQTLDEQLAGSDFYRDYLHAEHVDGNGIMGLDAAVSAPQPPILPNSRIVLTGLGGANNNHDPDIILPVNGAQAAFKYANSDNVGGILYDGEDYKLVYFAFAFEAVSGAGGTTRRSEVLAWRQDGNLGILPWWGMISPVSEQPALSIVPVGFTIESIYPNPFNTSTTLLFNLPVQQNIRLEVYNLLGQRVASLAKGVFTSGTHSVLWESSNLPTGGYFAVLENESSRVVKNMVLLK